MPAPYEPTFQQAQALTKEPDGTKIIGLLHGNIILIERADRTVYGITPRTIRLYHTRAKELLSEALPALPVARITPAMRERWAAEQQKRVQFAGMKGAA